MVKCKYKLVSLDGTICQYLVVSRCIVFNGASIDWRNWFVSCDTGSGLSRTTGWRESGSGDEVCLLHGRARSGTVA